MIRTRLLWAGLVGGALAGAGDALASVSRALLQASPWNLLHLLGLGITLGAAMGLAIALLAVLAAWPAARVSRFSTSLTAMAVASPLVVYDAFALFLGGKASRVPGHQVISAAIVVVVLGIIGLAAHRGRRWLARVGFTTEDTSPPDSRHPRETGARVAASVGESDSVSVFVGGTRVAVRAGESVSGDPQPDRLPLTQATHADRDTPTAIAHAHGRASPASRLVKQLDPTKAGSWQRRLMALGLFLLGAGAYLVNHRILPRLYSWFHLSLALLTVVACVLAVLLLSRKRGRGGPLLVGVLTMTGLGAFELAHMRGSQSLRFFAFEKTQIVKQALRVLPARPGRVAAGLAATVPSPMLGLPEGPRIPGADVVLITVDAVRADHVSAYGYRRPTTPNFEALAERGVRFERAYTQAPHTSFALASLMTGTYYASLARLAPNERLETLAHTFRRYGWKTAAFFPPAVFFIDAHKMKNFESTNFDFEYVKYEYLDAHKRVDQIEAFLNQEDPRKLFLWLHLFEPHEPYQAHDGHDFGPRDIDRYDSEIATSDAVVGKVIAMIEERRPNAIIIVAADHGEEFDEHGGRYHGTSLYDEQTRVPLVMVVPGVGARVVPGPVQLIDIAPTILGLLNLLPPARMSGTDLGPWLATPPAPAERLPPVFSELEDKRMVILGQEKLVCDLAKDFCSYFDLAADAGEQHDLADAQPHKVARLRQLLDNWLARQARLATSASAVSDNAEDVQAIERAHLGDAGVAGRLAAMLTSPAPLPLKRQAARALVEALPARPETRDALRGALDKADDDEVRDWAALAALRVGEGAGKTRALAVLKREGDAALRLQAALALAQAGENAGLAILTGALDECATREALCKAIVTTLGKLRDPAAVPVLLSHLADVRTRLESVNALGEIGDPAAVPALIERLKTDEYVPVRIAAAQGLARMGGARALLALQWSAENDPEPRVVEAVRAAIERVRQPPAKSP